MSAVAGELAALRAALGAAAGRCAALEWLDEVDSTNAELLRRGDYEARPRVLLADAQHAGHGRQGRRWVSPPGASLCLSVSMRLCVPLRAAPALSLVVGVACAEALQSLGVAGIGLKWPNDLLVDGRKLGGILVESAPARDGLAVVIGIGINLRLPAADADAIEQPWTDLARLQGATAPTRAALAAAVLQQLLPALQEYEREGFAAFAPRYARLDALRERAVSIQDAGAARMGVALGLADDGALRVRHDDGERSYHSGEVRVRAA